MKKLLVIGLAGLGAGLAWHFLTREETPAWQRKKQRKEARRQAARKAREQGPARPPEIHVEKEAATGLRVPLGDLKR